MAIGPVTRSGQPMTLTRAQAQEINCRNLRATVTRDLYATDVYVMAEAGHYGEDGKWISFARQIVPNTDESIADLFSPTYGLFQITIRYTSGRQTLDPEEKLTRLEFIMQTLEIWERMSTRGSEAVNAAIEVLKSTYSFTEMLPTESIRQMFDTTTEGPDGSS